MEGLGGRVALVTGASSGIGAAVAESLVRHAVIVVGCARHTDNIKELAARLEEEGVKGRLHAIQCDLQNEDEILAMFEWIKTELGGVDICVNNAGLMKTAPLLSGQTQLWKEMLDVNVLAPAICTREAVKSMRERAVDDGHIININSMSGHRLVPSKSGHFYCASKYAVTALTEGTRNELRELNSHIRITQISPGIVETEFHKKALGGKPAKKLYKSMPCLQPSDIADNVLYALSAPPHVQVHDILVRPTDQKL